MRYLYHDTEEYFVCVDCNYRSWKIVVDINRPVSFPRRCLLCLGRHGHYDEYKNNMLLTLLLSFFVSGVVCDVVTRVLWVF